MPLLGVVADLPGGTWVTPRALSEARVLSLIWSSCISPSLPRLRLLNLPFPSLALLCPLFPSLLFPCPLLPFPPLRCPLLPGPPLPLFCEGNGWHPPALGRGVLWQVALLLVKSISLASAPLLLSNSFFIVSGPRQAQHNTLPVLFCQV